MVTIIHGEVPFGTLIAKVQAIQEGVYSTHGAKDKMSNILFLDGHAEAHNGQNINFNSENERNVESGYLSLGNSTRLEWLTYVIALGKKL